jgi:WD40 repeat protein
MGSDEPLARVASSGVTRRRPDRVHVLSVPRYGEPIGGPLSGQDWVNAVAIGRAGDRDVIISGSNDHMIWVWDAVTGEPIGGPLAGRDGGVNAVAIGRAGDRDVIISGSEDRTVLVRQHRGHRSGR